MLTGVDERVLAVHDLVGVPEPKRPRPEVVGFGLDGEVAHLGRLVRTERAGVDHREVGDVEEVVDELPGRTPHDDVGHPGRVDADRTPLRNVDRIETVGAVVAADPHQAERDLVRNGRQVGPRRHGRFADGGDGDALARRAESPSVVRAAKAPLDDLAA